MSVCISNTAITSPAPLRTGVVLTTTGTSSPPAVSSVCSLTCVTPSANVAATGQLSHTSSRPL